MRVSAKADYALRALIEIANRDDGRPVSAEELGNLQEIPHGFLQAILADMRRARIVARPPGPERGGARHPGGPPAGLPPGCPGGRGARGRGAQPARAVRRLAVREEA